MTNVHIDENLEIVRRLGEGGQGKVFECLDKKTNKTVCAKLIPFETSQELSIALQESLLLSKLKHDHIIHIYKTFVLEDHPKFENALVQVMDMAPHGDLQKYLEKNPEPLPEQTIVDILEQIAKALIACHEQKIVHRDLKPENVLVFDMQPLRLILADFGLCKVIDKTQKQSSVGTPIYIAPEILSAQPYSWPADIYSFGVIAYKCMTRKARNFLVDRLMIPNLESVMEEEMSAYSTSLQLMVMDMLAVNAKERPSAVEIVQTLQDLKVVDADNDAGVDLSSIGDTESVSPTYSKSTNWYSHGGKQKEAKKAPSKAMPPKKKVASSAVEEKPKREAEEKEKYRAELKAMQKMKAEMENYTEEAKPKYESPMPSTADFSNMMQVPKGNVSLPMPPSKLSAQVPYYSNNSSVGKAPSKK